MKKLNKYLKLNKYYFIIVAIKLIMFDIIEKLKEINDSIFFGD